MTPRGLRNHNPFNIRHSAASWRGKSAKQTDKEFVQFDTPEDGIRAGAKTLLTYYRKHKIRTVRGIVNRFAPPVENDTGAYVKQVCKALRVLPDDPIDVEDAETLQTLAVAMIRHENGEQPYSTGTIRDAIARALAR